MKYITVHKSNVMDILTKGVSLKIVDKKRFEIYIANERDSQYLCDAINDKTDRFEFYYTVGKDGIEMYKDPETKEEEDEDWW